MATLKKLKKKQGHGQKQTGTPVHSSSSKIQVQDPSGSESQTATASSEPTHSPKWSVYTSIEQLTLDRFIDCACDGNLQLLVIDGKPDAKSLQDAWLSIKSQHLQNMNDAGSNMHIDMGMEIHRYDLKRYAVECLLFVLEQQYGEDIIDQLREEDYDYAFTEDSYKEDMLKVRAELGSEGIEIDAYRMSLQSGSEDHAPAKQVFYNTILTLQKHLGLCAGIAPMKAAKELTVFEFGAYCKEFNKMAKAANTNPNVNS